MHTVVATSSVTCDHQKMAQKRNQFGHCKGENKIKLQNILSIHTPPVLLLYTLITKWGTTTLYIPGGR